MNYSNICVPIVYLLICSNFMLVTCIYIHNVIDIVIKCNFKKHVAHKITFHHGV